MAGRPPARTSIVDVVESADNLKNINLSFRALHSLTNDTVSTIRWLAEHGLIRNSLNCSHCNTPMSYQSRQGRDFVDGVAWSCKHCRRQRGIRINSFFEGSHVSLAVLLDLVYWWSLDVKQTVILNQTGVSQHTVVDWQNFCRDICCQYLIDHPIELGGPERIVEIDESKFMHRKCNRGQYQEGHWVLGMIERGTTNCVMVPVEERSAQTLLPIIINHVRPGTMIVTDAWKSYQQLSDHTTVKHGVSFVDPNDPTIHTNTIKGNWSSCKHKFRKMRGTSDELFNTYLQEHMWRRIFQDNVFGNFLFWVRQYYNFD